MNSDLHRKFDHLRELIRQMGSVLVAYSGGVDSALVMAVAAQELGSRALACIGVSPSYPQREQRDAIDLVEQLGVPYRIVETQEYLDPNYAANPANRCYFCKSDLYERLRTIAAEENWHAILDGTNASDLTDDRPGRAAARERGVRSPLVEAQITKPEIRALAKHMGLPVWDKPAMACLSSRVPKGVEITPMLLAQIERAEDVLVELGFRQFRVRHHGDLARIELPVEDLPRALEIRLEIVNGVRQAGYQTVTLDLAGFRREEIPASPVVQLRVTSPNTISSGRSR